MVTSPKHNMSTPSRLIYLLDVAEHVAKSSIWSSEPGDLPPIGFVPSGFQERIWQKVLEHTCQRIMQYIIHKSWKNKTIVVLDFSMYSILFLGLQTLQLSNDWLT